MYWERLNSDPRITRKMRNGSGFFRSPIVERDVPGYMGVPPVLHTPLLSLKAAV